VPLDAIFFDAGNTLVFADPERTLAPLRALRLTPASEQLHAAERATRLERDAAAAAGTLVQGDEEYWRLYYTRLLDELGLNATAEAGARQALEQQQALRAALVREARRSGNWEFVRPGTREALEQLRRRSRLGVISNSDGRIAALLERVGIADCFECIVDSGSVGVEKPDPRIFQAALERMKVSGDASLYVGDVYSIDYLGARAAGMQAVLFDVCGAYRERNLPRVESLEELIALLR
jgi:HAD superfamily hydrolase (TIGR01509 family)